MEIKDRQTLSEYISEETKCYSGRALLVTEGNVLRRHIILLRKAEYHTNSGHRMRSMFYKFRLFKLQNRYGLHIPLNTCERGLNIEHLGPIIINHKARIGKNCRIHVGVNIGAGSDGEAPQIGDNCYIGPGAKIFNGIKIADNCQIGANAVVNKSCEIKGSILVGVPAKKVEVSRKEQNND